MGENVCVYTYAIVCMCVCMCTVAVAYIHTYIPDNMSLRIYSYIHTYIPDCSIPTDALLAPASRISVPVVSEFNLQSNSVSVMRRQLREPHGMLYKGQRRQLDYGEEEPGTRVGHAMVTLGRKVSVKCVYVCIHGLW